MTEKRKRGRPRNPNKVFMEATLVRDTPEQMLLLEATGHTHSEAYRLGSRILTKTKTPVGLKLEEIQALADKEELVIQEALERKQALLNEIKELELRQQEERQVRENQEEIIEIMTNRLNNIKKSIRSNVSHKRYMLQGALELVPEGSMSISELEKFLKEGKTAPDTEAIKSFLRSKIII
jgi:hypothetical protein